MIKYSTLAGVSALCVFVAHSLSPATGLHGALIGILIGLVMAGVSHWPFRWARRVSGQAVLAAMLGGVLLSFGIMAAAMLALASLWKPILEPAALTALCVYLVHRFFDAFQASTLSGSSRPAAGGGSPCT